MGVCACFPLGLWGFVLECMGVIGPPPPRDPNLPPLDDPPILLPNEALPSHVRPEGFDATEWEELQREVQRIEREEAQAHIIAA